MNAEKELKILDHISPFDQLHELNGIVWDFNNTLAELMGFEDDEPVDEEEEDDRIKTYAKAINQLAIMKSIVNQMAAMLNAEDVIDKIVDDYEDTVLNEFEAPKALVN